jgi:hypothetical protein
MKTHSATPLETFRTIGNKLYVRDNIEQVEKETDEGTDISYTANEYILPTNPSSDDFPNEELATMWWRKSASLSRRRFKIGEALYEVNGTPLVEQIEALLVGLPEPQKTVASISYNESNSFDRLDAFVVQFGEALGMSEEEVDDFFQFCIDEAWQ